MVYGAALPGIVCAVPYLSPEELNLLQLMIHFDVKLISVVPANILGTQTSACL